jgi:hypothetical protein
VRISVNGTRSPAGRPSSSTTRPSTTCSAVGWAQPWAALSCCAHAAAACTTGSLDRNAGCCHRGGGEAPALRRSMDAQARHLLLQYKRSRRLLAGSGVPQWTQFTEVAVARRRDRGRSTHRSRGSLLRALEVAGTRERCLNQVGGEGRRRRCSATTRPAPRQVAVDGRVLVRPRRPACRRLMQFGDRGSSWKACRR